MSRAEVLSGPERRRRWSAEEKQSIVAEAFAPGASVSEVARRRDVVASQIYRWRRDHRMVRPGFAEVVVSAEAGIRAASGETALEISLSREVCVRIAATAPKELAFAVIRALVSR
jgi:transposase